MKQMENTRLKAKIRELRILNPHLDEESLYFIAVELLNEEGGDE